MTDLDDLAALDLRTQVMFKDLLNGTIKIAFQKQRLVPEAKPGHALDGSDLGQLRNHHWREGVENCSITSPIEPLDFKFDDGAQAIEFAAPQRTSGYPHPVQPGTPK